MRFREACDLSQNGRAKRSTEDELWIILDPDCKTWVPAHHENFVDFPRKEWDNACCEVFQMVMGPDGIKYDKLRYAWLEEIETFDDWLPVTPMMEPELKPEPEVVEDEKV